MHFGASVRETLSISCGVDLREARAATALPDLGAGARRALAANLAAAFAVDIPAGDAEHWETVRDVLQCVRFRIWEQRVTGPAPEPQHHEVDAVAAVGARARMRFRRFVPPAPSLPTGAPALRRSKRS